MTEARIPLSRVTTRREFSIDEISALWPEGFCQLPESRAGNRLNTGPTKLRRSERFGSAIRHQSLLPAVRALAEALDAKDHYTRGHSLRVSASAGAIARQMGLSETTAVDLELAGELHDIGKIGIADTLLGKRGSLNRQEIETVNEHTVIGERILLPLFGSGSVVVNVARWHHERWDGCGGPDGLAGDKIPLEARIVAVADSFDAMNSSRPYRCQLSFEQTLAELRKGAGSQFDTECVRAMMDIVGRRDRRGKNRRTTSAISVA